VPVNFDRQITLQFATTGKSASGEPTLTYGGDVPTWARVEPVSGREYYAAPADQLVALDVLRFRIRFRDDVRPRTAQIVYQGRVYNIRSVAEVRRRRWLEVEADCKVA